MKITYGGHTFLSDPMLSSKGKFQSYGGIEKNPVVNLPLSLDMILEGVEGVLISHAHHLDHYDFAARDILPKDLPIFVQPQDEKKLKDDGFIDVQAIKESISWDKIIITRTSGKHGSGEILEKMGEVSGFVLQAPDEPTVYWLGDTILCDEVEENIKKYDPGIIISHSGGAIIPGFEKNPILMDEKQTIKLAIKYPNITVVAIHLEALDHCHVSRKMLRESAKKEGISAKKLLIPKDGETINL
jgi:L-ascorbate metabolism protein UlaG (beta-lactamase superfamily)